MAQNFNPKQTAWLERFWPAVVQLMETADLLASLANEYSQDTYGTGGANAITDATVQGILPAATAAQVASAVGIINGSNELLSIVGQNTSGRGFLEMMRP